MNERRRFLHVLGGGVAAIGSACGGESRGTTSGAGGQGGGATSSTSASTASSTGTTNTGCETAGAKLGKPSDFMAGLNMVPGSKVLVGKDAGGYWALSSICTHELC